MYGCFKTKVEMLIPYPRVWKILKEMDIPDHLTCLLSLTCMHIRKQLLELDMEKQAGSK